LGVFISPLEGFRQLVPVLQNVPPGLAWYKPLVGADVLRGEAVVPMSSKSLGMCPKTNGANARRTGGRETIASEPRPA
jgi:hypothetical protein